MMFNATLITIGILFLIFLSIRIVQATIHHRKFMAEYESHANDPLPPIEPENIPPSIRHLAALAEKWAIGDDVEREEMQKNASLQEKQAFVEAVWPHMDDIETWINKALDRSPASYEASVFMFLSEAAAELKYELENVKVTEWLKSRGVSDATIATLIPQLRLHPSEFETPDRVVTPEKWFSFPDQTRFVVVGHCPNGDGIAIDTSEDTPGAIYYVAAELAQTNRPLEEKVVYVTPSLKDYLSERNRDDFPSDYWGAKEKS